MDLKDLTPQTLTHPITAKACFSKLQDFLKLKDFLKTQTLSQMVSFPKMDLKDLTPQTLTHPITAKACFSKLQDFLKLKDFLESSKTFWKAQAQNQVSCHQIFQKWT